MTSEDLPMLMRVPEVAFQLQVSESVVYRLISDGVLATVDVNSKPGGRTRTRVTRAALDAFVASRTTTRPRRRPTDAPRPPG